jgi:hypothetical protein
VLQKRVSPKWRRIALLDTFALIPFLPSAIGTGDGPIVDKPALLAATETDRDLLAVASARPERRDVCHGIVAPAVVVNELLKRPEVVIISGVADVVVRSKVALQGGPGVGNADPIVRRSGRGYR